MVVEERVELDHWFAIIVIPKEWTEERKKILKWYESKKAKNQKALVEKFRDHQRDEGLERLDRIEKVTNSTARDLKMVKVDRNQEIK